MPNRNDIHGVERVPVYLEEFILRRYGTNPFDEPMWRIVLAENVFCKRAGMRKIWLPTTPVNERGGIILWGPDRGTAREARPWQEVGGVWERRKYPTTTGWIAQRWVPASQYDRTSWMAPENMTQWGPKLGPFPERGDYELMLGPFAQLPSISQLDDALGKFYALLLNIPASIEQRTLLANHEAEDQQQQHDKGIENFLDEYMRDKCSYIWSSSLEAGRIREEVARRCGITEHVGN